MGGYVRGVLLSGGIDSTALCVMNKPDHCFFVNYGQRPARREFDIAQKVSSGLDIPLHSLVLDCSKFGKGSMSNNGQSTFAPSVEWWPFRNQLLATVVG